MAITTLNYQLAKEYISQQLGDFGTTVATDVNFNVL